MLYMYSAALIRSRRLCVLQSIKTLVLGTRITLMRCIIRSGNVPKTLCYLRIVERESRVCIYRCVLRIMRALRRGKYMYEIDPQRDIVHPNNAWISVRTYLVDVTRSEAFRFHFSFFFARHLRRFRCRVGFLSVLVVFSFQGLI